VRYEGGHTGAGGVFWHNVHTIHGYGIVLTLYFRVFKALYQIQLLKYLYMYPPQQWSGHKNNIRCLYADAMKPTIHFNFSHNRTAQNFSSFQIDHPCVCTRDRLLVLGFEYQFLYGLNLVKVRLNHVRFHKHLIELNLYLIDMDRSLTVTTSLETDSGSEWRIFDKDFFSFSTFKVLRRLLGKGDQEDLDVGVDHLLLEFE